MRGLHLISELLSGSDMFEGDRPPTGQPLEHPRCPQDRHATHFVAAGDRLRLQVGENRAAAFHLAEAHQDSGEGEAWTGKPLERQIEALFEFRPTLEKSRRGLSRVALGEPDLADRRCDQQRIAHAFGLLQRAPSVDKRGLDVCLEEAQPYSERQNSCGAAVIIPRLGHRLVNEPHVVPHRHGQFEDDVGALEPRWNLLQEQCQQRAGALCIAGKTVEPGRS